MMLGVSQTQRAGELEKQKPTLARIGLVELPLPGRINLQHSRFMQSKPAVLENSDRAETKYSTSVLQSPPQILGSLDKTSFLCEQIANLKQICGGTDLF